MLDSNDGLKYVGLLSMVAIHQRLALMPTQKSKCEESLKRNVELVQNVT